ncbi:sulfatase family protein [Rhodopirellula baltica]|uniref:sulfatase family protein n=1 Tax=Rhodopirellula baltica TaxID=265606 RepID=UPI00056D77B2|nr:arylsulfatase [Rhodopirellula baltica]
MPFNQARRSDTSQGRSPSLFLPLLLFFACVASPLSETSAADNDRPNVIVVMADDLGYGDIGCYGAKGLETPNIDRMASEGCRFTSGYCSASTCTPTRYSFLTGTYAFRFPNTGIAPPNSPALIPAGTTTTASILKDAGYKTAVIGKWHLGLGEKNEGPDWNGDLKPGPLEIGFDHCILLPTTNDRVPQVYVNDHNVENLDPADPLWVGNKKPSEDHPTGITHRDTLKMDWSHGHNSTIHNGISRIGFYTGGHAARFRDEDLSDRWVAESKKWIAQHKEEPFFLFFASHDLHVPRVVHERFQGSTKLGPRGDAIAELDWCVGELMKSLEENGLTEKTMLVFCSDNGPVLDDGYKDDANEKLGNHDPNGPYQGGKYTVYEGGTRTPFITRMPGTIPVGVSDEMVCTIDFAASLAAMVGQELPNDACLDSQNVLGALMNQSGASGREHLVQQDNGKVGNYGYRVGDWKLVRHDQKKSYNFDLSMTRKPVPQFALYNLESDPAEQNDLSDSEPERAKQLQQELQKLFDAGRSR